MRLILKILPLKLCFITIFIANINLCSQHYNRNWIIGYGSNDTTKIKYGKMLLDFEQNPVSILYSPKGKQFELGFSTSCISDKSGRFLFYSDNKYLIDCNHQVLPNGDSINPGKIREYYINDGYPVSTASFFLPDPANSNSYYFIHRALGLDEDPHTTKPIYSDRLLYSKIDINNNFPKGIVTMKNQLLLHGNFVLCHLAACKHGNGRDWWIILEEANSNKHFIFLLNPDGVSLHHEQKIGIKSTLKDWNGDCLFTPDGKKYIKSTLDQQIQIFDFNRCTGGFSNPIQILLPTIDSANSLMVCASPNSKYLYASIYKYIFQFDLTKKNIVSSVETVGIWDWYYYKNLFSTGFYKMGLAPDNKIYITTESGGPYIHVIEDPDSHGKNCNMELRKIKLPAYYAFGIPTMPNYNLGPEDDCFCDNLGIDNIPFAYWNYNVDISDSKLLKFRDLSSYETTFWKWDFGDGSYSNIKNPYHRFTYSGTYKVCLKAININGNNSFCRIIQIGVEDSINYKIKLNIKIYPNPIKDIININIEDYNLDNLNYEIYNQYGQLMQTNRLYSRNNYINCTECETGIFYIAIIKNNKSIIISKLIKFE